MLWSELIEGLQCTVLVESSDFQVKAVAAADLLSDILATDKQEFVMLTGQTTSPAIRTATTVGALGMIVVRGKDVPEEMVELARKLGVPLAVSPLKMFEACVSAGALLWNSASSKS